MRISDWSSDVCSSDLEPLPWRSAPLPAVPLPVVPFGIAPPRGPAADEAEHPVEQEAQHRHPDADVGERPAVEQRPEEHTSELQSLMRTSYAVFCLKKTTRNCQITSVKAHICYQPTKPKL